MKRNYFLSLMTLFLVMLGGVEASAQTYDFEAWAKKGATTITLGETYYNEESIYPNGVVNYWKSIGDDFSEDVSRFATRTPTDKNGWYFDSNGLRCRNGYPVLVISKLLSGDEVEFVYDDGNIYLYAVTDGKALCNMQALTEKREVEKTDPYGNGDELKTKLSAAEKANGTVTIKVTADCDLIVEGDKTTSPLLKKITINRKNKAEYGVSDEKNYETPYYEFVAPGKVDNDDRVITDIFGITVTLGNIEKTNNVEVVTDATNGCGVRIYDDNNCTWVWNGGHSRDNISGYEQGTFYIFEPSVSGKLIVDGYSIAQNGVSSGTAGVSLICFDKNGNRVASGDVTSIENAQLKADYIYCLYANGTDTYCLKGFTYESNFHFPKKSVVIDDKFKENTKIVSVEGETTTYHADEDKTQSGDESRSQVIEGGGVRYSFEAKGDVEITDKDETDGTYVSWSNDSKGGAIVVTATHGGETTQYVITIPYYTYEWVFDATESKEDLYKNTAGKKQDWGLAWKVYRHPTTSTLMNELSHPVFSNAARVEGDNARFIDATAGLLFEAPSKHFGTNTSVVPLVDMAGKNAEELDRYLRDIYWSYNLDENVKEDGGINQSDITIKTGAKLIIPNLKAGQHIRFRWNRHNNSNGDRIKVYNVTDITGKRIPDGTELYAGQGTNNMVCGHLEFIAVGGDVEIEACDAQGWLNIKDIRVGEVDEWLETHLRPQFPNKNGNIATDAPKLDKRFMNTDVEERQPIGNEYGFYNRDVIHIYLHKKGEDFTALYSANWEDTHPQSLNNGDVSYHILGDKEYEKVWGDSRTGTLNRDNCKIGAIYVKDNDGNDVLSGYELAISKDAQGEAHGSFVLVLEVAQVINNTTSYVLDSIHVNVRVFEYDYNEKPYPYTWAMEHFTKDTGNNTLEEIDNDSKYWKEGETTSENGFDLKHRIFKVGYPENMIAWMRRTDALIYKVKADETFTAGETIDLGNVSLTYGFSGGNNFSAAKGNNNVDGYTAYTEGNGTDGKPDGGTVYIFQPKYAGKIEVAVVLNNDKKFYILEDGNALEGYNGITVSEKYYGTYTFDVKAGSEYKVYCEGSKLGFYGFDYTQSTSKEKFVPEFDGLGFIPEEYWDHHDTNVQLEPAQNGIKFSKMGENPDKTKGYRLIVPNVGVNQTLYLATTEDTDKSSVSIKNGDSFTPLEKENYTGRVRVDTYRKGEGKDNGYDEGGYYHQTPLNIYKVNGKGGDIELLLKDLILHKVAVSVEEKRVSEVGYATEAREYPLDFTLARLFLGKEQKAYKVTDVKTEGSQPNVELSEVRYIPATTKENVVGDPGVNNGVIITGYDLETGKKVSGGNSWPLFTTDIDRATSDMDNNKLVGVVTPTATDKENNIIDQKDKIGETEYYNYLLATNGYVVKYQKGDGDRDDADIKNDHVAGTINGLGFYLVLAKGTKIDDNVYNSLDEYDKQDFPDKKYIGGLPNPHSAYLKLRDRLAQINEMDKHDPEDATNFAGVHQVFFIDIDSILTGIDEVLTDDDELPSAGENAPANILQNGVFYTLQGVPVKNPTKGIYIFNGKKVYVK